VDSNLARDPLPATNVPRGDFPAHGGLGDVAHGVACLAQSIVNLYFIDPPPGASGSWLLVDAGLPLSATKILSAAEQRYGQNTPPEAILLTHGHFDHVGAVRQLAEHWDVKVYAHRMELPYITGRSPYPPPDPAVGGGGMSLLSRLYPRGPIDLGNRAVALADDGSLPGTSEWRWIPSPGHTPGHVSFFRDADGTLIVGDAFVTTKQESALASLLKLPRVWRPPAYYTCDWHDARQSIQRLADLRPSLALTGHGVPIGGERLTRGLAWLLDHWGRVEPSHGRYIDRPALTNESGVLLVPPQVLDWQLLALGAGAALGWLAVRGTKASRTKSWS
jgi:glyoxylase-like metal-dependent hydrolase (beta-lactamase superfamily II)